MQKIGIAVGSRSYLTSCPSADTDCGQGSVPTQWPKLLMPLQDFELHRWSTTYRKSTMIFFHNLLWFSPPLWSMLMVFRTQTWRSTSIFNFFLYFHFDPMWSFFIPNIKLKRNAHQWSLNFFYSKHTAPWNAHQWSLNSMLLILLVSGVFWDLCSAFLSRACLAFGGRDARKKRKILKNIKAAQCKRLT